MNVNIICFLDMDLHKSPIKEILNMISERYQWTWSDRVKLYKMDIKVTPLGAGQDVGRSCLLLSIGGKNIMLDCGMHMGFNDDRFFI